MFDGAAILRLSGDNMPALRPTWFDWITVAAIIIGPVFALFAQRALDSLRDRKKQRTQLYFTLMSTRNQLFSPAHLQALNSIDIVFKKDQRIRNAWKAVLDQASARFDEKDAAALAAWNERLLNLRVDLYQIIGQELGYQNTTDYIMRSIYSPKLVGEVEEEWHRVRRGLVRVLDKGVVPVKIVEDKTAEQ
jgi:hypothetical protein